MRTFALTTLLFLMSAVVMIDHGFLTFALFLLAMTIISVIAFTLKIPVK